MIAGVWGIPGIHVLRQYPLEQHQRSTRADTCGQVQHSRLGQSLQTVHGGPLPRFLGQPQGM